MFFRAFIMQHEDLVQVVFYAVILVSLWLTEKFIGALSPGQKLSRTLLNGRFIFTALPIQLALTIFVIMIVKWVTLHHWGLINFVPFHHNLWINYIVLFILMDLGEYLYHVTMHKLDPLWRFHLVHHSDLHVDVSTTLREHPVETGIRTCFLMLWVFLFGAGIAVLMIRQVFQSLFNILAHTEFRLPKRFATVLGWVFITPNLHHVHHHHELPYTDRNYGDVLSIWDRLFGTYSELDPEQTKFGIDTHLDPNINARFANILLMPFKPLNRKH
ncbi:MAG: sterol desaturase family protein [Bacteroidota bacterium]|nr:sterol desaturase family protein [Bacteroidota bacterium]